MLISTVAVFENSSALDDEDSQQFRSDLAYGRNRRTLEVFCADRFPECLIVRLPALFAPGRKKNFRFDMLNPVPTFLPDTRLRSIADTLPFEPSYNFAGLYTTNAIIGLHEVNLDSLSTAPFRALLDEALVERNASALQFTNPESRFHFYDLGSYGRMWNSR